MQALILATLAAVTTAMPSYIAVPADQIAFVDLSALRVRRVPRQTLSPPPPPPQLQLPQGLYQEDYQPIPLQYQQIQQQPVPLAPVSEPAEPPVRLLRLQQQQQPPRDVSGAASFGGAQQLSERPPDFGEYVDFGAHTGDNGAFGWYADYPINNQHESHY